MMRFLDTSAQAGEASVRARPSEPLTWPGTGLTACSTARARRHLPRLLHAVAELASDPNTPRSAPWRPPLLQRLRLFPRRPPLRRQRATRRPRRARRRCRRCTSTTRTRGTRPRKRRAPAITSVQLDMLCICALFLLDNTARTVFCAHSPMCPAALARRAPQFLVTLRTTHCNEAGTKSPVFIKIIGSKASTGMTPPTHRLCAAAPRSAANARAARPAARPTPPPPGATYPRRWRRSGRAPPGLQGYWRWTTSTPGRL